MHTSNLSYTYRATGMDPSWVTEGMWDFVIAYLVAHPETAETWARSGITFPWVALPPDESFYGFDTNLEFMHVPSFRRPDVQEWFDTVDANPLGFYKRRWGDAPLRLATTTMFFEKENLRHLCSFSYEHQGYFNASCTCDEDLVRGKPPLTDPLTQWGHGQYAS